MSEPGAGTRPRGEPLGLQHQALVAPALARLRAGQAEQAISDPTFANLYLFRTVHQHRLLPGPWPAISGLAYDGTRYLLPLFDVAAVPLADWPALLAGHDALFPLSAAQAATLDPAHWALGARRDDADYLYPAEHFRHYRGTALNKKRNLVRQLHKLGPVRAEPYTPALQPQALALLAGWMADKAKAGGDADESACTEALALAPQLGLQGWLHWLGDEPAGFVLAEPLQPGVWVMRFAKGLDRFKGIYQHMFQHFSQATPGVMWLNFEQDLGLANFRRAKLAYQPSALLDKHRAHWRG